MLPAMLTTSAAVLLGLGASGCWAVANVSVQRSTRLVGTFRALLWAQVLGGVALAALALGFDQRTAALTFGTLGWLVGAGVASLLAYLCMFYAFEHGRLSIAVPIMSGWAVISGAISVLLLREPIRAAQLLGGGLALVGVILVARQAGRGGGVEADPAARPRWVLASLGASVAFGVLIPAISHLGPSLGRLGAISAVYGVDIALGLPLAALYGVRLGRPPRGAFGPVALAGLFETAGFACIALGAGRAPLAVVSPLASLASAMTVIYAWIVLRDRPAPAVLLGAGLVCAGVVLLAL
jgi:drug/metabolite transporter (DMT)-like permease